MAIDTTTIQNLLKQTFNQDIDITMGNWHNIPPYNFYINGVDFSIFQQKDGTFDITNNIYYDDINMNSINSKDVDMEKIITHMMVLKIFSSMQ